MLSLKNFHLTVAIVPIIPILHDTRICFKRASRIPLFLQIARRDRYAMFVSTMCSRYYSDAMFVYPS